MKNIHIKTFGCQMNFYDSELVSGLLKASNYNVDSSEADADVVLVNTCTVRQSADQRVLNLMTHLIARKKKQKNFKIGLLGCMAENLGPDLQETLPEIDLMLGPDSYRDIVSLLRNVPEKSYIAPEDKNENYDDVSPYRSTGTSTFLAISRGCNNSCSYCIIPSVRGKERSRSPQSIIAEVHELVAQGFTEVILLGQNVNTFNSDGVNISQLLKNVSEVDGINRVRFTTSHPKDFSAETVEVIKNSDKICSHIHLPIQSGSDSILKRMKREYTRDHYLSLIDMINTEIPDASVTTDIISGFPGETEQDHKETLDLLDRVKYHSAFTFKYSPREGTESYKLKDDVEPDVKTRRMAELVKKQREISAEIYKNYLGRELNVMVETTSKRSSKDLLGKSDCNKNVIIPDKNLAPGALCKVKIVAASSQTLIGKAV